MTTPNKQILLIDGSSFIFRAFYALPNLSSPSGVPTGAVYGVLNMLQQMQKRFSCAYWCCIFDAKGKTFRDEMYPDYKATRRETPPELIPQFSIIHKLVAALGITVIIHEGVEADDVIGSIATQHPDYDILIATGDKDFAQIVNDKIHLINTMTNEYLNHDGVMDKFGVNPTQIIDYLALVGDTVDNVPGVPKCGPKTAVKWLEKYQNLENIIINHKEISGVVGQNLADSLEWLPMAKRLVTIKCDINLNDLLPSGIKYLERQTKNTDFLLEQYQQLGFRTWFKQLRESIELPQKINKVNVYIKSPEQLSKLIKLIQKVSIMVLHENINDITSAIRLIILSDQTSNYIITLNNNIDLLNTEEYDSIKYFEVISNLLINQNVHKICLNYKQLLHSLATVNLQLMGEISDITLAHYILNSQKKHDLESIYQNELNITATNLIDIYGKGAKTQTWSQVSSPEVINNLITIVANLEQLELTIIKQLNTDELHIYQNIEIPLARALYHLEYSGIKIDKAKFANLNMTLKSRLNELEQVIYQETQNVFNINSTKQLQDVLFNKMHLPTIGIPKNTNGYSTNEESLSILSNAGYAIANTLLEHRNLSKLLNTYVEKLPLLTDKNDRIHTSLEQTVVSSGRLSSKDPNLQNIPVRNDWGRQIRQCFVAQDGYMLVCADYSQIELRILAHISGDTNLLAAFAQNNDIHKITASEIFNKSLHDVTKDERRYAKTINFGLIYGQSVFGLAKELNITRDSAKVYIDAYFNKYPKIKKYMDNIKQYAHQNEFVSTVLGRKIYLPNINSNNRILSSGEERLALNAPMQGTSADIIKIAMNNISVWLKQQNLQSKLILQVHDELIFEVPINELESIQNNIPRLMTENIMPLDVNLVVDLKYAYNWDEAH